MADPIRIRVTVSDDLAQSLKALSGMEVRQAVGVALRREGEAILRESQRQVPVDDSPLKSSGRVVGPEMMAVKTKVAVTYGGAAKAYAEVQHEREDYAHSNGQKAKYLEDPWLIHVGSGQFEDGFAASVKDFIRSVA